ncbi:uncharacterized protein [Misgurnus anguillicaudatus]|uniref:uncharacterized protein isoform X1 n=1 Tax=Misgurnus anguillicaudatus TaxID=75329 RepID=UPI003CCFDF90
MIIRCSEMNFSFVLISGLIFSCFCSKVTCLYEEISVNQSPNNITVNESESAEISCCWTKTTFDVKVVWLKNERRVSGEPHVYQKSPVENCSTLHITNITPNDTGEYVCKVIQDIPILRHFIGSKTILTVIYKEQSTKTPTTTDSVYLTSSVVPVTTSVPSAKKPVLIDHPKTNSEDKTSLDGHFVDSSNESEVVVIYIFRCLPFLTLVAAFFYLNRDDKRAITSKTDQCAVISEEQPKEDVESGDKCRNDTEDVKLGVIASVEEEDDITTEKPESSVENKEEKVKVILDTEGVTVQTSNNEEVPATTVGDIVVSAL